MSGILIFGHRGACGHAPENTLASFRKALELGVPGFEFDIQLSKDGQPMVIHDDTLERTTNGIGAVSDYSYAELQQFDAGNGEKIPHLDDIFALADKACELFIEIKAENAAVIVAATIKKWVKKGWRYDQISVVSFNHQQLAEIKKIDPQIRVGATFVGIPQSLAQIATDIDSYSLNPAIHHTNQALVDDAHARGLKVFCWTVNDARTFAMAKALGVDGVFSDVPNSF